MKLWRQIISVCLIFAGLHNCALAQNKFEIDLKGGYAQSISPNWSGNSGWSGNLNLSYQLKRNNVGLSFAYYNQQFQADNSTLTTKHFASGFFYSRTIINKPRFTLRLGGTLGFGVAYTYKYIAYYDMWYPKKGEEMFAPKLFTNGYYVLTDNIALSYELNTQYFSTDEGVSDSSSGTFLFNALIGVTFLLPTKET
jgi:hypothetical protein